MNAQTLWVAWKLGAQLEYRVKPKKDWKLHMPFDQETAEEFYLHLVATREKPSEEDLMLFNRLELRIKPCAKLKKQ